MGNYLKNIAIVSKKIAKLIKRDILKRPVENYFRQNNDKSVLISYITKPFRSGIDISHTNFAESLEIAKVFNSLQFNVDIADYDYEGFIDYKKYDVIFGFGEPLVNSFAFGMNKDTRRIYYGTGMHISVQNQNSLARVKDVKNRKDKWIIESGRVVEKAWTAQTTLVDAMIVLGNDEVKNSYEKFYNGKIFTVNPSFYRVCNYDEIIRNKDFSGAKKNFLWLGSSGLIHKGLDLVLETFKSIPDLHLHVCGPVNSEQNFEKIYFNELFKTPNIHTYGFIKLDTALFRELLNKCAFVIYPSCSEGGSPSVINVCGNGGLIPVLTKEVTLNTDGFGITIEDYKIDSIKTALQLSQSYSNEELRDLSKKSGETMSNFTLNNFSDQIRRALITTLNLKTE